MPKRTIATDRQRELFAAISEVRHLVLGVKDRTEGEPISLNAHGRFYLFDKYWPNATEDRHETLLAYSPDGTLALTPSSEPLVHLHVDWTCIRYGLVRERERTLIGADKEIVLCTDQDPKSRVIWFYFWEWHDVWPLAAYRRDFFELGASAHAA